MTQTGEVITKYREENFLERLSSSISLSLSILLLALSIIAALVIYLLSKLKKKKAKENLSKTIQDSKSTEKMYKALLRKISKAVSDNDEEQKTSIHLRSEIKDKIEDKNACFAILSLLDDCERIVYGEGEESEVKLKELKAQALKICKFLG